MIVFVVGAAPTALTTRRCNSKLELPSPNAYAEREEFVKLMRKYEAFSDIKVLGYCIMSNHVHIMAYVPPARPEE